MPDQHGRYIYTVDGETPVSETWCIHSSPDGAKHVTSERLSEVYDIQINLVACVREDVQTYDFVFHRPSLGGIIGTGHYRLTPDTIAYRKDATVGWTEENLDGRMFFPLMRIFTGSLLMAVIEAGGKAKVIVPYIEDPSRSDCLFTPTVSSRKVWLESADERHYRYVGGQYKDSVKVWLDQYGIMERYTWTPKGGPRWSCSLEAPN